MVALRLADATFDTVAGRVICGQAVTKDVEGGEYSPELKLSEL